MNCEAEKRLDQLVTRQNRECSGPSGSPRNRSFNYLRLTSANLFSKHSFHTIAVNLVCKEMDKLQLDTSYKLQPTTPGICKYIFSSVNTFFLSAYVPTCWFEPVTWGSEGQMWTFRCLRRWLSVITTVVTARIANHVFPSQSKQSTSEASKVHVFISIKLNP